MNEIMTIQGIECYEKGGTAYLKLETVARGLGFTQAKNGAEYVRWDTVFKHLDEMGFPNKLGKDGFIPENAFYRLAMKAKNETAERFQALIADEVLPSIRKRGMYATPDTIDRIIRDPDFGIKLLSELKQEREQRLALEAQVEADAPKVLFAKSVECSNSEILVGEMAKILKQNGHEVGQNRLFEMLRRDGFLISRKGCDWNMPTQRSMEMGIMRIKETSVTHADGHVTVSKTPKITGKGQIYFVKRYAAETREKREA